MELSEVMASKPLVVGNWPPWAQFWMNFNSNCTDILVGGPEIGLESLS